ncbi:MAG: RNA-binding protein [Elusimicrobia bacterium CG1_02_56_21]|nr:MAG: RNA-binding protein [Elusimicrobia bacterium CG1_02_56_21]
MKDVLMYIIGSLVENPQAVKVGVAEDGDIVRFKLLLASSDRGKVIGKEGRVVKAIRTVLQTAAARQNKKVYLDID